jgi:hypothetical protein
MGCEAELCSQHDMYRMTPGKLGTASLRRRRISTMICDASALDALKESGDLEYAADVVLFLTEAQERCATPPARAVELTVAQYRHGDTGKVGWIFRPDVGTMRHEPTAGIPRGARSGPLAYIRVQPLPDLVAGVDVSP